MSKISFRIRGMVNVPSAADPSASFPDPDVGDIVFNTTLMKLVAYHTPGVGWAEVFGSNVSAPTLFPYNSSATFTDTTGKAIQPLDRITLHSSNGYYTALACNTSTSSVNLTLPGTPGNNGQILATDGTGVLSWVTPSSNQPDFNILGVPDQETPIVMDGTTGKVGRQGDSIVMWGGFGGFYTYTIQPSQSTTSDWTLTLPATNSTNGYVLRTDGNGVLTWSIGTSGNVAGPSSSIDGAAAIFSGTNGKTIVQNTGSIKLYTSGKTCTIQGSATAADYTLTLPSTNGTNGTVLALSGGVLTWVPVPTSGIVSGPASSTVGGIARWDGSGGTLTQMSGATITGTNYNNINVQGAINGNIGPTMSSLINGTVGNSTAWDVSPTAPTPTAFSGGVVLPNGKILMIPRSYTGLACLYDPATNTFGNVNSNAPAGFIGGVLLPNGKVFMAPYSYVGAQCLYDPIANDWRSLSFGSVTGGFFGGVLLPNGKVFCVPAGYTGLSCEYDPSANAMSDIISNPATNNIAFDGGVLLPNGKVFCIPRDYTGTMMIYDPSTRNWLSGPPTNQNGFVGGVLLPNGKVFMAPRNYTGTSFLYDPVTNNWATSPAGPTTVGGSAFYGCVLMPNGKVLCIPNGYTGTETIYNPIANTWEAGPSAASGVSYYGGVLMPNGKVLCLPYSNAGTQYVYNPGTPTWPYGQWMLHPFFNKF